MVGLKEIAKKLPIVPSVYKAGKAIYRTIHTIYIRSQLQSKDTEQVFTDIYRKNSWGGKDSVSGPGSDLYQTRIIIKELPNVFKDFNISTILDIPCGDFFWMKDVDLSNVNYTGADIVDALIAKNTENYRREKVSFQKLNLINDNLPKVDLIFCRDCLIHFSFDDIFRALENICNSQSKYLLTTTFTGRTANYNIVTGEAHDPNFELPPFSLPKPLKIINEGCTEKHGADKDKSLGLWRVDDIRESLKRHSSCSFTSTH